MDPGDEVNYVSKVDLRRFNLNNKRYLKSEKCGKDKWVKVRIRFTMLPHVFYVLDSSQLDSFKL